MDQTLLNEIVARVAAKLAAAEAGPSGSAGQAEEGGRERLLLLGPESDALCQAVLGCDKLNGRYQVDCASLQNVTEADAYAVVVLTSLSNEALAKLALGICDTPCTKLASQAILLGKKVYVPTEGVELYRYASTAPAAYYAMMKERLDLLTASGVVICSRQNLEGILLAGAACSAAAPESPEVPAAPAAREEKLVHVTKRVLTERDVREAAADKVTCIHIPAKCILTALAKDSAKERGIRLVQE